MDEKNTLGFFSRDDNDSYKQLEKYFNQEGTFFIEEVETQKWLTEDEKWTSNPLEAKVFKKYSYALTYLIEKGYGTWLYRVTEHEFVDKKD
jgi:hypothetical protein